MWVIKDPFLVLHLAFALLAGVTGTSVLPQPQYPQLPVIAAPLEFRFATACGVANCAQCSFDSSRECSRCSAGYFAFKHSYDALSRAPLCLDCAQLGCAPGGCTDQEGCSACPLGAVLTADVEARSTPRGAVVYSALPTRCRRCGEDLRCAACADGAGCTTCPLSHAKYKPPGSANYSACIDCGAGGLGCSTCEDHVGCTACPPGSILFTEGEGGSGLVRCKSCAELNCGPGWCADDQGCTSCPDGFVLSQNISAVPFPPRRCLSCAADLKCQECGKQGCTACGAGMYLKDVSDGSDLFPRTECASCAELGCAASSSAKGCMSCPEGSFLDNSSSPATCKKCSSELNCGVCGEAGCESCPTGSYLTPSLVYPGKQECARCQGCLSCSAATGCDKCLQGYFHVGHSSSGPGEAVSLQHCVSCAAANCGASGCKDGVGCASCLEGTYLYQDTEQGYQTCRSCSADLNCALCGDGGCKTCPWGFYRCKQTLAKNNQTVTGCCPCTGCAKCQNFRGCTACPYNFTLTELLPTDPFNTCLGDDCSAAYSCQRCDNLAVSLAAQSDVDSAVAVAVTMEPAVTSSADSTTKAAAADDASRATAAVQPQACNVCPAGQFLADPTAPFLDCRDCATWLGCATCSMAGCTSCPPGAYLATGSSSFGANVTTCSACAGCLPEACADNYGCLSCPGNFSMGYGAAPFRRCYECGPAGLNCEACSDQHGCTACPEGYFLDRPSAESPWYCPSCQVALGCSACHATQGCTACPEGFVLARLGNSWNDVSSCVLILAGN